VWALLDVLHPSSVYFLDESSFGHQTMLGRQYGWARGGERAREVLQKGFNKNTTLIAVLGLAGVPVVEFHHGGTKADRFLAFWLEMVPRLPPGAVVVLDNARIHHTHHVRMSSALMERGGRLVFLPPYSPDMSPIELMYGHIKRQPL
jgi:transposase